MLGDSSLRGTQTIDIWIANFQVLVLLGGSGCGSGGASPSLIPLRWSSVYSTSPGLWFGVQVTYHSCPFLFLNRDAMCTFL